MAIVLLLTGCTVKHEVTTGVTHEYGVEAFCDFQTIATNFWVEIVRDNRTGCLYAKQGYGMVPIMKPDGTCLTYIEWKEGVK